MWPSIFKWTVAAHYCFVYHTIYVLIANATKDFPAVVAAALHCINDCSTSRKKMSDKRVRNEKHIYKLYFEFAFGRYYISDALMAPLSNTGRFFEVSLRGTKSELPTCGIWGNVRYYPTTALYNSWACVSRNLLRGESRLNWKQNTVCLLCPQLLIIKMEFVPQSNPCWRTSPCSLIYDYLHVKSCQWSPMKEKTDTFDFFFSFYLFIF